MKIFTLAEKDKVLSPYDKVFNTKQELSGNEFYSELLISSHLGQVKKKCLVIMLLDTCG